MSNIQHAMCYIITGGAVREGELHAEYPFRSREEAEAHIRAQSIALKDFVNSDDMPQYLTDLYKNVRVQIINLGGLLKLF